VQKQFRTTNAAQLENLQVFRDFVDSACAECGVKAEDCFDLILATDEACTNVIQHGYAGMNPGSIILELEIGRDEAILHITDFGHPFEPRAGPPPDMDAALEDRPIGGLGLFIIYSVMDSVDYRSDESGNTLMLTKKLAPDS
jgi:anti-sigma regulatory factor (Ser/Thr protein kinase)